MKKYIGMVITLVITLYTIGSTGCSPTGWATKEVPDGSAITPGNNVTVLQKDGNKITGTFIGEQDIPPFEYFNQYTESVNQNPLAKQLPEIGERIEVTTSLSDSRAWVGQLVGFDKQSVWIQFPHDPIPTEFYISSLTTLSHGNERFIGGRQFRQLYLDGLIPLRSALVISGDAGNVYVPLNTVARVVERSQPETSTMAFIPMGSK